MTSQGESGRPLFGKRVLVTRAREQASQLSRRLADAGALPVELPTIQIEPPESWTQVDRAVGQLDDYAWVVFTSANGVRWLFQRLETLGRDARALGQAKVAAIGPATAEALRAVGVRADFVPSEYVAEAVAAGLAERGVAGERVLVARAAEAREALVARLRSQDARVDEVAVYRTVPALDVGPRLRELLDSGDLDVVTFASSSTVRSLVGLLGDDASERLARCVVACIGPITAQTAQELGLRVDVVAAEYTIPGLVRALEEHYR